MADWDNTAPVARDLSSPGDNTAPTAIAVGAAPDNTPAVVLGAPAPEFITMPASFNPAFIELTGSAGALDTLNASAADLNKVLQGTVGGRLKSYQVRAGTDATALPGIVRCANYDGATNAIVFVQL